MSMGRWLGYACYLIGSALFFIGTLCMVFSEPE